MSEQASADPDHARGGAVTRSEVTSQPHVWRRALGMVPAVAGLLTRPSERLLLVGCGTSAFVARALAALREDAGLGETHWAYASEMPVGRRYDKVVAITRSGTTTEVLEALATLTEGTRRSAICATAGTPVADCVDELLLLDFADERSVVQTRFPTTTLLLARAAFGQQVQHLPDRAEEVLREPTPLRDHHRQFVFLARGWALGLAEEAALKTRESAQAWAEAYPTLDYRHGPVAVAGPDSLVWVFGQAPEGLTDEIGATGATVVHTGDDPLVDLVAVHALALALAEMRGLDPDRPRRLTRSVILTDPAA